MILVYNKNFPNILYNVIWDIKGIYLTIAIQTVTNFISWQLSTKRGVEMLVAILTYLAFYFWNQRKSLINFILKKNSILYDTTMYIQNCAGRSFFCLRLYWCKCIIRILFFLLHCFVSLLTKLIPLCTYVLVLFAI